MVRRITTGVIATMVMATVAFASVVAGAVSASPSWAAENTGRRITVTATGQVKGTPDVAEVTVGVSARGRSAADALATANDRAAKVITALRDGGVQEDDVQTSGLSVQPTYGDDGTVTGYEVTNLVNARLRDIPRTGEILDAVARVAGDEIRLQGISFSIDDDSALLATARTRAVKRARAQAEQLADAAGVELGAVRSIDEGTVAAPYDTRTYGAADASSSMPIEPGTQTLSLQATVVFEIS
jgi:uncharacterized protein YggE